MLSSEFNDEMGSLLRSLSQRVQMEPLVHRGDKVDALDHIERAIIALVAEYLRLKGSRD